MTKQAQISDEHKRAIIAVLCAQLGHIITLRHDLQTGDGVVDGKGDKIPPLNYLVTSNPTSLGLGGRY